MLDCPDCGGARVAQAVLTDANEGPYRTPTIIEPASVATQAVRPTQDKSLAYAFYVTACGPFHRLQSTGDVRAVDPANLLNAVGDAVKSVAREARVDSQRVLASFPAADVQMSAHATRPAYEQVIAYLQAERQKQAGAQIVGQILGLLAAHVLGMDGSPIAEPIAAVAGSMIGSAVTSDHGVAVTAPLMEQLHTHDRMLMIAASALDADEGLRIAFERAERLRRGMRYTAMAVFLAVVIGAPLQWFGGGLALLGVLLVAPFIALFVRRLVAGSWFRPSYWWGVLLGGWAAGWCVASVYGRTTDETLASPPPTLAVTSTTAHKPDLSVLSKMEGRWRSSAGRLYDAKVEDDTLVFRVVDERQFELARYRNHDPRFAVRLDGPGGLVVEDYERPIPPAPYGTAARETCLRRLVNVDAAPLHATEVGADLHVQLVELVTDPSSFDMSDGVVQRCHLASVSGTPIETTLTRASDTTTGTPRASSQPQAPSGGPSRAHQDCMRTCVAACADNPSCELGCATDKCPK